MQYTFTFLSLHTHNEQGVFVTSIKNKTKITAKTSFVERKFEFRISNRTDSDINSMKWQKFNSKTFLFTLHLTFCAFEWTLGHAALTLLHDWHKYDPPLPSLYHTICMTTATAATVSVTHCDAECFALTLTSCWRGHWLLPARDKRKCYIFYSYLYT